MGAGRMSSGVLGGDAPVALFGCGTIALCHQGAPAFAGFCPRPETPGVWYHLPVHRFAGGPAAGRAALVGAHRAFARFTMISPSQAQAARAALALVSEVGYPHSGDAAADADVVAAWERADGERVALVRCRGFPPSLAVLVRAGRLVGPRGTALAPDELETLAALGRDSFRLDVLGPIVVTVLGA